MRQRKRENEMEMEWNKKKEEEGGIARAIKSLDMMPPKLLPSTTSSSSQGGFLSVFVLIVIMFIIWEEGHIYMNSVVDNAMFVDATRNEKMRINLDITFHKLKCAEVQVDAVDRNGDQQIAVAHNIVKTSVRRSGEALSHAIQPKLGDADSVVFLPHDYCGSCFGAAEPGVCCNTCEDLKEAYKKHGRSVTLALSSPQCMRTKNVKVLPGEDGCKITGHLEVSKLKGNFHVAAGASHAQNHQDHKHHIHHVNRTALQFFDISHTIHSLSFGEHIPDMQYPLNGFSFNNHTIGQMRYFIKLVPTLYETELGAEIRTNQFSVTEHFTIADVKSNHFRLPGVYFEYDFYPMRIKYSQSRKTFTEFIIRVCAIIGGLYVILGFVFSSFHKAVQLIKGKREPASSLSMHRIDNNSPLLGN